MNSETDVYYTSASEFIVQNKDDFCILNILCSHNSTVFDQLYTYC